jgi:hypothetical protein
MGLAYPESGPLSVGGKYTLLLDRAFSTFGEKAQFGSEPADVAVPWDCLSDLVMTGTQKLCIPEPSHVGRSGVANATHG